MRRANDLLGQIADLENLYLAFWKAAKGKRYKEKVLAYQVDLQANLLLLRSQLLEGRVAVGDYHYFKIYEPKERQICASAFPERVLHHALMNVCHERFECAQIFDSYASRRGKGVHKALARAKQHAKRYDWYLKLDVKKFFDSLHHDMMKVQLCRLFKEEKLLLIFYQIIDSYEAEPQRGVPIGNLTSQYFANHYLTSLDHFVKEVLRIKAYVRYMDDIVLWSSEKSVLNEAHKAIAEFLNEQLKLKLKPLALNRSGQGLPFLGYRIFPHDVRLLGASKSRFIRKQGVVQSRWENGEWSELCCQRHIEPLVAFTRHANALAFRRKLYL